MTTSKANIANEPPIGNKQKVRIAYGAGGALAGLMAEGKEKFDWIVDDTPGYAGQKILGCEIRPSEDLLTLPADSAQIVVCAQTTTASRAISRRLEGMGFCKGVNFCDCSDYTVQQMNNKIERFVGNPFEENILDQVKLAIEEISLRNLSGIAGTWLFTGLLETLRREGIPGSIAEAGVYQGANAIAALRCSPTLRERTYYLMDSFEGLRNISTLDPNSREGEFSDVNDANIKILREAIAPYPNANICKGYFEETLPGLSDQSFALAYIDCDLAEPARFCMDWFWDRLTDGGFLLIHDYWFPDFKMPAGTPEPFRGIKAVADQFLTDKLARFVVFPETTHLLIRKEN